MTTPNAEIYAQLAQTHAAANQVDRHWSAEEFAALISGGAVLIGDARSFVLGQIIAGEGEVLTLATHPRHQRQGLARAVLNQFCATCETMVLEVAADNTAARALYQSLGFVEVGRRAGYYRRAAGAVDALVQRREMTQR